MKIPAKFWRAPATLFLMVSLLAGMALADLRVVASIPDLGVMAERIGGDKVEVISLASGREDLHAVPVRPSFLPKLNRADIVLSLGLDAEHAWLPALAREARNRDILPGRKGWVEVHSGIEVLDKPEVLDRREGDQHPQGNSHFNIGPQSGVTVAENIARAFIAHDPDNAAYFENRLAEYRLQLENLVSELQEAGKPLQGLKVVSYHPDVIYLTEFYGMTEIGSLEPKPGVQPTSRHLARLAEEAMASNVRLVLFNQAQNPKLPGKFAADITANTVQLANMVGAKPGIHTWEDLQRYNLQALLDALNGNRK